MINRILGTILCLTLLLAYVQAKFIPLSICDSKLSRGSGRCRERQDCTYFKTENIPNYIIDSIKCNVTDDKLLYCCPTNSAIQFPGQQRQVNVRYSSNIGKKSALPEPPNCGRMLTNRIYGGVNTAIDEFPWTARLEYTSNDGRKGHHCGGSLVSAYWVVTAAHCVTEPGIEPDMRVTGVRLGEWNTGTNPDFEEDRFGNKDEAPPHVDVSVERVIPHADFNEHTRRFSNDIALLRLKRKVEFSDFIWPICLPLKQHVRNELHVNSAVEISGWGHTERNNQPAIIKQKAQLNVVPLAGCQQKYRIIGFKLDNTQMCAVGKPGVDACSGDSGGPLMIEANDERNNANLYLSGIVSFGQANCSTPGFPGVYTRLGAYIDWIENEINTLEENLLHQFKK